MTRILIIEDEPTLRDEVQELLGFEGFEVAGASNGIEGVRVAREILPDLIICDVIMPKMDGYGVLLELHADAQTAAIPFIFLTARGSKNDWRRGMELGADDYLTKPFTRDELLRSIQSRLEKQAAIDREAQRRADELRRSLIVALPIELGTPLVSILGFGQLLELDAEQLTPERIGDMANRIVTAGKRLHHLIEKYLLYSQIEIVFVDTARRQYLAALQTLLPGQIVHVAGRDVAEAMGRVSDLRMTTEETPVFMAEDHLQIIIRELLSNAFQFSAPDSLVLLEARVEGEGWLCIIEDQGKGMSLEQIQAAHAIVPFESRVYERKRLGLGLSIVRRLIELHGGQFVLTSVPEKGTRAEVWLRRVLDTPLPSDQGGLTYVAYPDH